MTTDSFKPANPPEAGTFAYVHPGDAQHTIYLDQQFHDAPRVGTDTNAGTLAHEMSHFNDMAATKDVVYGQSKSLALASNNLAAALSNADSF